MSFFCNSPLEQFQILPLVPFHLGLIDFSLTNSAVAGAVSLALFIFLIQSLVDDSGSLKFIPSRFQLVIELMYKAIVKMVVENVGPKGEEFFPFVFSLFCFVLVLNVSGLVPYCFTMTSHFAVVFTLAIIIFFGVNYVCVREHKLKFFSIFFPQGTALVLGLLLVPIEIVSYVFKPLSLSIRLFANMVAGHTLIKVIAGFAFSLAGCTGLLFLGYYAALLLLVPLYGLELGVSVIQAYVFTLLTCIYINDSVNLH